MENKPKFNLMDAFIIVLILAVATVGVLFVKSKTSSGNSETVTVRYSVEFKEKDAELGEMFKLALENGESATVTEKDKIPAKIVDVEVVPSTMIVANSNTGKLTKSEIEGKYDIIVTLESEATETDKDISLGATPIAVGEELAVHGRGISGFGYTVAINYGGEN